MTIQLSNDPSADYFIPSTEWIANLQVGDLAPDAFGRLAEVVSIHARDVDIHGRPFVCLYTRLSETSNMSGSFKAGELHRSLRVTNRHSSHELSLIERSL